MTQTLQGKRAAGPVTIRGYRPSDHSACRELWAELTAERRRLYPGPVSSASGPTDPGAGFEEYLTRLDLSGMWVAQHVEDDVVGFVGLILQGRAGTVDPVVVSDRHRAEGIGTALLEHVADQARSRGLRELSVSPALRNVAAIHCLRTAGYRTVSTVTLTLDLTGRSQEQSDGIELHGVRFSY